MSHFVRQLFFALGAAACLLPSAGFAADPLHVILYDDRTDSGNSYDNSSSDPAVKSAMNTLLQGNADETAMEGILSRFKASSAYQSALKSLKGSIADCSGSKTFTDFLSGDQSGSIELDTLMLPSSVMSYSVLINFPSLVYTGTVSVGVQQSLQYDHDSLSQNGIEKSIDTQILGAMNSMATQNRQSCAYVKTLPSQSDSVSKVLNESGSGSGSSQNGNPEAVAPR